MVDHNSLIRIEIVVCVCGVVVVVGVGAHRGQPRLRGNAKIVQSPYYAGNVSVEKGKSLLGRDRWCIRVGSHHKL